jgi:hypothetical protein
MTSRRALGRQFQLHGRVTQKACSFRGGDCTAMRFEINFYSSFNACNVVIGRHVVA